MINIKRKKILIGIFSILFVFCLALFFLSSTSMLKEAKATTNLTTLSCLTDNGDGSYSSTDGGNGWRFGYTTMTDITIGTSLDFTVSAGIKLRSTWNEDEGRIGLYINYVDANNHLSVYFKCLQGTIASSEIVVDNYVNGFSSYTSCWPSSKQYITTTDYSTLSARCYYSNGYKLDISFIGSAGNLNYTAVEIKGTGLAGQTSGNPTSGIVCVQRDCTYNNVNISKASSIPNWEVVSLSNTANISTWNASGANYVGTNTSWKDNFLLTTNQNYTGNFSMVATFQGTNTSWSANGESMGFVPYYMDENNYILIYLDWNKANSNGVNEIMVHGLIDGKNLRTSGTNSTNLSGKSEWNDIWLSSNNSFKTLKPNEAFTLQVTRTYDTETGYYVFRIQLKRGSGSFVTLANVTITNFTQEKAAYQCKGGFYTINDTVTVSNYSITNYGNNGNVGFGNTGNGGYGNQAGNNGSWAYNASTQTLIANANKIGNTFKGTYALATNTKTSYYFGAKMIGVVPDSPVANEGGGSEFYAGLVPYYTSDTNSIFINFFRWSDSTTVYMKISAMINGVGAVLQADDTYSEFAEVEIKNYYLEAEHYVETQISGNTLNIFIDRSVNASYSYTINGLSSAISANKGYYGASVQNYGCEYVGIGQSDNRIFTSITTPVIYTIDKVTSGRVGQMIPIPATCSNGTGEYISPTVTVKNSSQTSQTVYNKSTSIFYFYPTDVGNYTVNITAKDKFGTSATAVSYTINVLAPNASTFTVVYNGNNATSGSMDNQTIAYNTDTSLSTNAYKRTNYTFIGWSTSPTATTATYTDKQSVKSIAYPDETITLYAVWKIDTVTVTVINGTVGGNSSTVVNKNDAVTVVADQAPAGKVFIGWSVNGVIVSTEENYAFNADENITITAEYQDVSLSPDTSHGATTTPDTPESTDTPDNAETTEGTDTTDTTETPEESSGGGCSASISTSTLPSIILLLGMAVLIIVRRVKE